MRKKFRLPVDGYLLLIVSMVALAALFPVEGQSADVAGILTKIAIGLVFFLHGARLSPKAAIDGARHWRLHLLVLLSTFALFPVLGLMAGVLVPSVLAPQLYTGLLFLCTLPSTVQSSIGFTSIARGNIPAAICSASASNLIGIALTPLLVGLILHTSGGGISAKAVWDIVLQLLVPFVAGQVLRPLIGTWAGKNKKLLGYVDRGSILLVVYVAFSEGVVAGIWHQIGPADLAAVLILNAVLLALVIVITTVLSRRFGFSKEDEIAIVFCGSKKSLASGLPMASVLFAGPTVGLIVLPLMLFHQMQLMVCAWLARKYAARPEEPGLDAEAATSKA